MTSEYPETPLEEVNDTCTEPETPVTEEPLPTEPVAEEPVIEEAAPVEPAEEAPAAEEPVVQESTPVKKPAKAKRRKPHIALRIPLQILSFVLSFVLFFVVLAGILLMDLRQLTSAGGIKQLISAVISSSFASPSTVRPTPETAPIHISKLSTDEDSSGQITATLPGGDIVVDENGNISIGGGAGIDIGEIPEDLLKGDGSNVSGLVDWLYDQIDASTDKPLTVTKEEMQSFVEKSTVSDFLADKLSQYADDFINGTENATITTDEIMELLDENADLMKSELNIELTTEQRSEISSAVDKMVEENDLSATIRDKVYETVDQVLAESSQSLGGIDREDIQNTLQLLSSNILIIAVAAVAGVLLILLCLLNFYNVPAGLTWAALPCISAGALMSLPILVLQFGSDIVMDLIPELGSVINILATFVGVFAPVHYGVLIGGVALLIISIIWRIIRAVVRKKASAVV